MTTMPTSKVAMQPPEKHKAIGSPPLFCYPLTMHKHPSNQYIRGPVPLLHLLLQQFLKDGDVAVDATCGNGKDTIVMSSLVGENGHIWGFDIQQAAIERTRVRLNEAGLEHRVTLLNASHHKIEEHVSAPARAVIFNLGWLPGGEKTVITQISTTIPALEASLRILIQAGILAITCYPGHDGGDSETEEVVNWASSLPPKNFHVWRMGQMNVSESAPFCIVIQKTGTHDAA